MKHIYFLLCSFTAFSQVTIKVTDIPSNTPVGAAIYFAGNINDWNPGNASYILQPDGSGDYYITIPEGAGTVQFKFTRGSWATVEGNASGGYLPDRSFAFNGSAQTIYLTIQSWEDLGGTGGSTASDNVSIIDNAFFMPQLNTSRRIWLYLPPDYDASAKHYPVLYMHDGQNLFDVQTSFAGEWEVDETLNTLFNNGDYGAIVVGIDNGGATRLDEYSPWVNAEYGGGDGDDYMTFIAQTLKPYIDANYRTRPEPAMTALVGSSMGALISTYGALAYPDVFRKVGSMSPAYWFAADDLNEFISTEASGLENHRMYFVAGQNESPTMVSDVNTVVDNLIAKGLDPSNAFIKMDSYGTHTEGYWKGEFGALYSWLFENENLDVNPASALTPTVVQISEGRIYVDGLHPTTADVIDMTGQKIFEMPLSDGMNYLPENLSDGIYIVKDQNQQFTPKRIFKR